MSASSVKEPTLMLEPVTKLSGAAKAIVEVGAYLGVSVYAASVTTAEVSIGITVVGGVVGVVVWLVRLEGRINTQGELLGRMEQTVQQQHAVLDNVANQVARIAGRLGVRED